MFISIAGMRTSASSTPCAVSASSRSRTRCMPKLIKDRAVVEDTWTLVREASSLADVPPAGRVIVPLSLWLANRNVLRARGAVGVWLAPNDKPELLGDDVSVLPLIAIDFP